jgi:hypothetical protein
MFYNCHFREFQTCTAYLRYTKSIIMNPVLECRRLELGNCFSFYKCPLPIILLPSVCILPMYYSGSATEEILNAVVQLCIDFQYIATRAIITTVSDHLTATNHSSLLICWTMLFCL